MNRCRYCGSPQIQWEFSKGSNGWTTHGCSDQFECGSRANLYSDTPDDYTHRSNECLQREIRDLMIVIKGKDRLTANWSEHAELLEGALNKYREEDAQRRIKEEEEEDNV